MPDNFVKLVYLAVFIIKKFVTMHGHMNVKLMINILTKMVIHGAFLKDKSVNKSKSSSAYSHN
jgi:hypothetical protein